MTAHDLARYSLILWVIFQLLVALAMILWITCGRKG
jgi:hypothetical protein